MRVKVQVPNGNIISRVGNMEWVGNFLLIWVRYKGKKYLVNYGDEYLQGYPKVFELGKEVDR